MRSLPVRIRAAALISVGALAVHDLRFVLAYRGGTAKELSVTGHGYLGDVTPLAMGVLALAIAAFAWRLLHPHGEETRLPSTRRMWAFLSGVLIAIYASQEWIEGQLSAGHAAGLAGIFGSGGWLAVPLALIVALVIALLLRGAETAIALAGRSRGRSWLRPRPLVTLSAPSVWRPVPGDALAYSLAPRGPPLASV
jgi:hypothetical protein